MNTLRRVRRVFASVPASTDSISLRAQLGDPRSLAAYLDRPGVLRSGHFQLLSGLHSNHFLAFSAIAEDSEAVDDIASLLLPSILPWQPSIALAPSTAGVTLGAALADRLGVGLYLASLDEQSRPVGIVGEPEISDERVLLINDVVTTGQSLVALAGMVRERSGQVVGSAWFAARSDIDVAEMIEAPTAYLLSLDLRAVPADRCPACARGTEAEDAIDLN